MHDQVAVREGHRRADLAEELQAGFDVEALVGSEAIDGATGDELHDQVRASIAGRAAV